ncbi:hypothetical protein RQM47_07375 [Rubrivirga sp. S365]|uniref:Uncharacterized protein n=1 Tax=Rubrivirga litoralis TaxID=3075598 RepID=A0ABU3BNJ6_9BACT|nr:MULTISPECIES: hypothetical protein [unclassified Rubrivirga]MDT0630786.1 hypothetical protein [Rubrivirga sp. F394]MDT7856456.1 hypothetical protein [Rubrivirga sp. S365]
MPILRPALALAALVVAGCGPPDLPARYEIDRAVLSRRPLLTDTLSVPGGADTLDVVLSLAVVRGRTAWALLDPDGAEVWGGAVTRGDTAARHRALRPAPGPWRFVLRSDSAVGTAEVRGSAR